MEENYLRLYRHLVFYFLFLFFFLLLQFIYFTFLPFLGCQAASPPRKEGYREDQHWGQFTMRRRTSRTSRTQEPYFSHQPFSHGSRSPQLLRSNHLNCWRYSVLRSGSLVRVSIFRKLCLEQAFHFREAFYISNLYISNWTYVLGVFALLGSSTYMRG